MSAKRAATPRASPLTYFAESAKLPKRRPEITSVGIGSSGTIARERRKGRPRQRWMLVMQAMKMMVHQHWSPDSRRSEVASPLLFVKQDVVVRQVIRE